MSEEQELDTLSEVLKSDFDRVLDQWIASQLDEGVKRSDLLSDKEIKEQCRSILSALRDCLKQAEGDFDFQDESLAPLRDLLETISRERVERGVTPDEMSRFIMALKPTLFDRLKNRFRNRVEELLDEIWLSTRVVDQMGLYTMHVFLEERDAIIRRQQDEMMDLSTPVVQVWEGVVTLPLIGTLDSERAQMVMENILDAIVDREAKIAIIDITGVPSVDTLVAQHLIKTAAAIRLMGAECVISGISPRIAQTIVHLGVDMPQVVTRGTLETALAYAFQKVGLVVNQR